MVPTAQATNIVLPTARLSTYQYQQYPLKKFVSTLAVSTFSSQTRSLRNSPIFEPIRSKSTADPYLLKYTMETVEGVRPTVFYFFFFSKKKRIKAENLCACRKECIAVKVSVYPVQRVSCMQDGNRG
jgi:hypothetical protein